MSRDEGQQRRATIQRMRADGVSVAEIREALGLTERQVRWALMDDDARKAHGEKSNAKRAAKRAQSQGETP